MTKTKKKTAKTDDKMRIVIRVPAELHEQLAIAAAEWGCSVAQYCQHAAVERLKSEQAEL